MMKIKANKMKVYAVKTSLEYIVEIEADNKEEAVLSASKLSLDRWQLCNSNIRGYDAWEVQADITGERFFIRKVSSSHEVL